MHHQVTAYNHGIDYYQIAFVVIDMEAMIIYLAARKLWHAKRHFDLTRRALYVSGCTIFYFIRPHLAPIMFSVFYLYHVDGNSAISQSC